MAASQAFFSARSGFAAVDARPHERHVDALVVLGRVRQVVRVLWIDRADEIHEARGALDDAAAEVGQFHALADPVVDQLLFGPVQTGRLLRSVRHCGGDRALGRLARFVTRLPGALKDLLCVAGAWRRLGRRTFPGAGGGGRCCGPCCTPRPSS